MSTQVDYIEFVCEQIRMSGDIRYRKMFGEYMVYLNDKPLFLVCDNTVYVKMFDEIKDLIDPDTKFISKLVNINVCFFALFDDKILQSFSYEQETD